MARNWVGRHCGPGDLHDAALRGRRLSGEGDLDYSADEAEFMRVLDDYKRAYRRPYPSCSEVLAVLKSLGYRKADEEEPAMLGPLAKILGPLGTAGGGTPPASSLLTGLVAYYAFETLTLDSTGNGHTLTNNNGVTQVAGVIGNAANFAHASSQSLTCATGASLQVFTNAFSIACWVKQTSSTRGDIVGGLNGQSNFDFEDRADGTVIVGWDGFSSFGVWPNNFGAAAQHLVAVFDGGQSGNASRLKLYVNGSLLAAQNYSGTIPTTVPSGSSSLQIGNGLVGFLDASVDELGLWNVPLSATQVAALYNSGAGITYPFTGVP